MRMIGAGIFWGVVVMLIGLGIIINVVFRAHLPIFQIMIGLVFIYWGVRILFGGFGWHRWMWTENKNDVIFHQRTITDASGSAEYNAVFGKLNLDLRGVDIKERVTRLRVNSVFGGADIWLAKETPVKIIADAAFAEVRLPENSASGFGTSTFVSENFNEQKDHLELRISSVFGSVEVSYR